MTDLRITRRGVYMAWWLWAAQVIILLLPMWWQAQNRDLDELQKSVGAPICAMLLALAHFANTIKEKRDERKTPPSDS